MATSILPELKIEISQNFKMQKFSPGPISREMRMIRCSWKVKNHVRRSWTIHTLHSFSFLWCWSSTVKFVYILISHFWSCVHIYNLSKRSFLMKKLQVVGGINLITVDQLWKSKEWSVAFLIEGVSKTMWKGDKLFRVENVDIAFIYALSNFFSRAKNRMDTVPWARQ